MSSIEPPAGAANAQSGDGRSPVVRFVGPYKPSYETGDAAGADLKAWIQAPRLLAPGSRCSVPTGIRIELPAGFEAQVRPRSGLAARCGVTLVNAPGTIDSDYRGEIVVLLINLGDRPVVIEPGERVAQLVIAPVTQATFLGGQELASSARNEAGFGSTGRR